MTLGPDESMKMLEQTRKPDIGSPNQAFSIPVEKLKGIEREFGMTDMDYRMLDRLYNLITVTGEKMPIEDLEKYEEIMAYLTSRDIEAVPCLIVKFEQEQNSLNDIQVGIEKLDGCKCILGTRGTLILITDIKRKNIIVEGLKDRFGIDDTQYTVEEGLYLYNISKDSNK